MSLNILTDSEFDRALRELVEYTGKTKSQIVRELVLAARAKRTSALPFGALAGKVDKQPGIDAIVRDLKSIDDDLS